MADVNLKKLAAKMAAVAGKKQMDSKDLTVLREIKDGISQTLQELKECDSCGSAVTEIVRMEIEGVRAAVCHACGIKALKNKGLVLKHARHREKEHAHKKDHPASHKSAKPESVPANAHAPAKAPKVVKPAKEDKAPAVAAQPSLFSTPEPRQDLGAALQEIGEAAGIKPAIVRRILQIASSVAFPMNLERTLNYTRMEAQRENINLDNEALKKVISGLVQKAGLKLKE
ncbi:MAG: hypothetical protein A2487_06375 [Candidatus Raymondbacteria bacterium RifOxyC12_full_50_8]|uniref:Uncharacterized protein n=1 Tax=Candidatus Raymondbacteria bacterium RIFOXYD12_FULL_49_13 TaxID=1817890 RepID=A0A1F7FC36_UNCRA|nr:MAG: hypothetical protein A2248_03275 [Candidatus Raymondbacteria bacterium RIFOXYA2_FULL_49_16]OGJ93280.1 MAG: hypothetical protein A2350_14520 [Candidatus Raymondbacteria bacterium RifOxyB12_full_50_8]OGK04240.1 MAG: hypothetical protein A2519_17930 [Candidatus Raymondbacteria bacterium RIFOXYD12_FULL_49_13]OGK06073.1 MAG: hypothetical protein A2487_06375 [Candidatus Raymondbacteria bacterium RifOxyC12_full_50_8]OGP42477.1 MAG: hypothetical protein A2324_17310 [Candidatus Raymondbacteria b